MPVSRLWQETASGELAKWINNTTQDTLVLWNIRLTVCQLLCTFYNALYTKHPDLSDLEKTFWKTTDLICPMHNFARMLNLKMFLFSSTRLLPNQERNLIISYFERALLEICAERYWKISYLTIRRIYKVLKRPCTNVILVKVIELTYHCMFSIWE